MTSSGFSRYKASDSLHNIFSSSAFMLPKVVTQGNSYILSGLVSSFDMQPYHSKTTDSMCGPRENTSQEISP